MEKAKDVFVLAGKFGWNDVGSWEEVYQISPKNDDGNAITGNVISINSKNSYIYSQNKLIAAVGVENLIVIETNDSILICSRDKAQDVKEVVNYLKQKEMNDFL